MTANPALNTIAADSEAGVPEKALKVERVIELEEAKRSIVAGCVVKEVALRREVVGEYSEIAAISSEPQAFRTMCSEGDRIILEDDSGRVALDFSDVKGGDGLAVDTLVTGAVVAVTGIVKETGDMMVEGIFAPASVHGSSAHHPQGEQAQEGEKAATTRATSTDGKTGAAAPCVILMSGLEVGKEESSSSLPLQLLVDYISGSTVPASALLDANSGANAARLLIAGNACAQSTSDAPMKELDAVISQMCSCLPVDIIPGPKDPTNSMLPQAPIHPCLLPSANSYKEALNCCPNPYSARIGGLKFLGTSGQPVEDMRKYTATRTVVDKMETDNGTGMAEDIFVPATHIEALEACLRFRHLAPTAPDSIVAYPFTEEDPFIIDEEDVPDFFFAGNCGAFDTKIAGDVRLICIPNFEETGQVVKVDLDTKEVTVLKFEF